MNTQVLRNLGACSDAVKWTEEQCGPAHEVWQRCKRGDWLIWYAARCGVSRETLVLCACDCARLVLHLVPKGEDRPRIAIETTEAWTRGEATIGEVRKAKSAAAAFYASYASYASYAYASYAAAAAAAAAADASYAAASAAAAAASYAADARSRMQSRCADAVRARISWFALGPVPR